MTNNQLASIIQESGIARLFRHESGIPKVNAQENLKGINHFADESTLRFFGSRISSAHETSSGLLFYIIESSSFGYNKTKRGFRYAIFDIFGESVARPALDEAFSTSKKARKAMYQFLDTFSEAEHYKKALLSIAKRAEIKAEDTREALAQITDHRGGISMTTLSEAIQYAKQAIKKGFLIDYYFTDNGDIVGISDQGEFMWWMDEE